MNGVMDSPISILAIASVLTLILYFEVALQFLSINICLFLAQSKECLQRIYFPSAFINVLLVITFNVRYSYLFFNMYTQCIEKYCRHHIISVWE